MLSVSSNLAKFAPGRRSPRLALGLGLSLLAVRLMAASLTATLDENTTPLGEPVTLSLIFEGVKPDGPPALPAVIFSSLVRICATISVKIGVVALRIEAAPAPIRGVA